MPEGYWGEFFVGRPDQHFPEGQVRLSLRRPGGRLSEISGGRPRRRRRSSGYPSPQAYIRPFRQIKVIQVLGGQAAVDRGRGGGTGLPSGTPPELLLLLPECDICALDKTSLTPRANINMQGEGGHCSLAPSLKLSIIPYRLQAACPGEVEALALPDDLISQKAQEPETERDEVFQGQEEKGWED